MSEHLENLLPASGITRWYPFNEAVSNGQAVTLVNDHSPNAATLSKSADSQTWQTKVLNNRNGMFFDPSTEPLRNLTSFTAKHIFVVAKKDGLATFGGYQGLLTGLDPTNEGILVGDSGTTKFYDNNYDSDATYKYYKSQVNYPENNLQAPSNKFELIEVSRSTGWLLDGLSIGQDRDDDARKFTGRVLEILIYNRVLTTTELKQVRLYFDLKFGLWKINNTTLVFPNKDLTGLLYTRFWASNSDKKAITAYHEYEDGGRDFIEKADNAPRRWEIEINCHDSTHRLSKDKTDIFDQFWEQAGIARTFSFTDKYGETHEKVRIEDYSRDHTKHQSWLQDAAFKLVKYP